MMLSKPVEGEILSAEDQAKALEESKKITVEQRAELIKQAKARGIEDRAVVTKKKHSHPYSKYVPINWGIVVGFSYTTNDQVVEVAWVNQLKSTYHPDDLSVVHKGMTYQEAENLIDPKPEIGSLWENIHGG